MGTDNVDLHSFYTLKLTRWKGNYPRIFSIGSHGIATYNPADVEKTNYWPWNEVYNLSPLSTSDHPNQFQLVHKKNRGTDAMKFETEHRAHLLTLALLNREWFAKSHQTENIDRASTEFKLVQKYRWGQNVPGVLNSIVVTCVGVEQVSQAGKRKMYLFENFNAILELKSDSETFAIQIKNTNRLHIFAHSERSRIIMKIRENCACFIGTSIPTSQVDFATVSGLIDQRLGKYAGDEHITSLCEFSVQNQRRERVLLCLSETCLIERDPGTYLIKSLFPLSSVYSLVRAHDDPQAVHIELCTGGEPRTYYSTERDSLLSSLMDGARASGNNAVHVRSKPTPLGKRWGPLTSPVDEKVESLFLKFVHQLPQCWTFSELLLRFNVNVQYSGLLHAVTQDGFFAENKEKLILVALNALIARDVNANDYEEYFQMIRRIVCSKTAFGAFAEMQMFREKLGGYVVTALRNNMPDPVIHSALDVMAALMQPMHIDADLRQEQDNKEKILNSPKFLESLLDVWTTHVKRGTGALVTMSMLDILTFGLCAPYSETTLGSHFDSLLLAVATRGQVLYSLFQHPSVAVVKGAGLVMKALIEEGQGPICTEMQEMSLKEGALVRHLINALFLQTNDPRLLTLRQLSRHLVSLWTCQNPAGMDLLRRILPAGLLRFLDSDESVDLSDEDRLNTRDTLKLASAAHKATQPSQISRQIRNVEKLMEKQVEMALKHWRLQGAEEVRKRNQLRPVALRKHRQNLKLDKNWNLFYHKFSQDHARPDLIWNYQTREELRESLQAEVRLLDSDRDHVAGEICWNHADFQIQYQSLQKEIQIGGYYLRLLLEEDAFDASFEIQNAKDFFADLYHRFLLTGRSDMRGMCLQALTTVYGRHWQEIGVFTDLKYIVIMLEKSLDKMERDRLLLFLQKLVLCRENARELVNCGGLEVLVDLISLAHLHTSRAVIPTQTNVIEASPDMRHADSPEWYYMPKDQQEKIGPVGFQELKQLYTEKKIDQKTKCWGMGLETWKQFATVAQLKWFILADKQPSLLNETKMATVILDIFIQVVSFCPAKNGDAVIRPIHKSKQILTHATHCLPHIVQLLLTFDPAIVERVATLLFMLLEENPWMDRVYATGVFFFIMMYTGSNIIPVSRFLKLTHLRQNTYFSQQGTSVWQKSVLGSLLPEAMVAYLENHGIDKFSEIFLGEFDTPEAIWSSDMRRQLIEKIALHLADFTPKLQSNVRVLYEYCAIPAVNYPNLENELFCNVFYLRNLTDEIRFPNWPIKEPLNLLKDVLESWKNEVEKKPPPMTVTDALRALEIDDDTDWVDKVKKNYRRLAQKYHPDKNPAGRERFEEANKAYEFLCSRNSTESTGPCANRIVLILRAQSILFKRCGSVLAPYKYSGYPMLIKTMEMEIADEQLFAKEEPLLASSADVVYHTLNCSSLNVEELRREKGLEVLLRAYDRCVSILNKSSKTTDVAAQVCVHVTQCFTVATKFQLCRDKLVEMPQLAHDVCRILQFKHLRKQCVLAAECVTAMAVDTILQMQLLQAGVLWHLLQALFMYDFTLEEAGVEVSEDSNQQIITNNFAKMCVLALKSLSGYGTVCPTNDVIRASLEALLTPYGAKSIREKEPEVVLKMLNENSSTPCLVWNNTTRMELQEYCDQQLHLLRTGDTADITYGSDFVYSVHQGALVIGSVFVKIYNQEPTFPLENPAEFVTELLAYLSNHDPNSLLVTADDVTNIQECLTALSNVLKNNAGLETLCKGNFRLFTRYLMSKQFEEPVLHVLASLMASQECINDVVGMGVLPALLVVSAEFTPSTSSACLLALVCLTMMVAHAQVAKEAIQKGAIVYLMDLFCRNNVELSIRHKAAEVLSRLCGDKLSGPRVKIILSKFLPTIFCEAMTESPQAAVNLFDSCTENPEIVWNENTVAIVRQTIQNMKQELYSTQRQDLSIDWKIPPESFQVDYSIAGELIIGGIYIQRYVTNPTWNLRKPREFLRDLLDYAFAPTRTFSSQESDSLDLVGSAVGNLLQAQPNLCDAFPSMGYISQILVAMESDRPEIKRVGAIVLRRIAGNHACLESLCHMKSIQHIVNGMKKKMDMVPVTCEALNELYSAKHSELVAQALQTHLIPILLDVLKSNSPDLGSNPSAVKANVAHALQSMAQDEKYGQEVDAVLSKSDIWQQFCQQRHDLFLSDKPSMNYLGSSSGTVAGYLTQGSITKSSIPTSPPPLP